MDDSGSFSETLHNNAVSKLLDADDSSCILIEDNSIHEALSKPTKESSKNRRQRRKGRGQPPLHTESTRRPGLRPRASRQNRDSIEPPHSEMLHIIEINDDSPPTRKKTNWKDTPVVDIESDEDECNEDDGEILRESSKTEDIYKEGAGKADFSISSVDIEDEVAIYVKWRMKASKAFHLKRTDTMKQIFEHIAREEGVLENQLQLTYNGGPISVYDTAEKFKGSVVVLLEGRLKTINSNSEPLQEDRNPNEIELKLLTKDKKDKLSIFIMRSDNLEVFMKKAAKQLNLPRSKLLFKFDGETLDGSDTIQSLDLDGGECIEAIVKA